MKRISGFFSKHSFNLVLLLFSICYLAYNFKNIQHASLFLVTLLLLVYPPMLYFQIGRFLVQEKKGWKVVLWNFKFEILFLAALILVIYFLSDWKFLSAVLWAPFLYALFVFMYFYLKPYFKK